MDKQTRAAWDNLFSDDNAQRGAAYDALLKATEQPVDWAYAVWDGLLAGLRHPGNHQRSIAAQVLANLAKSDPQQRMLKDFEAVLAVTRDERFVTARHALQSIWKIGTAGPPQRALVVRRLADRFADCAAEKNCTLIRYDLLEGLRKLYDTAPDPQLKARALALIETEPDPKYRKKYMTLWRSA